FTQTTEQQTSALLASFAQRLDKVSDNVSQVWSQQTAEAASALQAQWERVAEASEARQQQICATLERVATSISTSAAEQSQQTISEIRELAHATAQAPKAAAEVIGQLRAQISDGIERDNAMLEERA